MMCQRPNCAYVHPTFANYMYKNQMKKKKGKKGGMPFGVMQMNPVHMNRGGPKPPRPDDQAN